MRILSNKFYSEKKGEGNEEHNGPAFKRRGFSVFMKVTELISYLKVKIAEPIPESALKRLLAV